MNGLNITGRTKNVCKDCPEKRRIISESQIYDCHDHCEKFLQEKQRIKELKERKHKANEMEFLLHNKKGGQRK